MGLKILQLSDIHIGHISKELYEKNSSNLSQIVSNEFFEVMKNDIKESIADIVNSLLNHNVDIVIVTGDIFDGLLFGSQYYKELIEVGVVFFNDLLEKLIEYKIISSEKCKCDRLILVPGNHEINRNCSGKKQSFFDRYNIFLKKLFENNIPSNYNRKYFSTFHIFEKEKVVLVGYNSACYKNGSDYGFISSEQFLEMKKNLYSIEKHEEYSIVAFLHHHFYLIEERYKDYVEKSTLRNSQAFLDQLSDFNLKLILHGHKHENSNHRINTTTRINKPDKLVTVLGCGTTDKKYGIFENQFNYIEVYETNSPYEVSYQEFKHRNSGYKAHERLYLPLTQQKNVIIRIEEELRECYELYKSYNKLKGIDSITLIDKIMPILDNSIGNMHTTAKAIHEDPLCLVFLLGSIHFRFNMRNSDNNLSSEIIAFININCKGIFVNNVTFDQLIKFITLKEFENIGKELNRLIKDCNYIERKYLRFAAIGIFITELFITLYRECDAFYSKIIKPKAKLRIDEKKINNHIEVNDIVFKCDEDKRALNILVRCTDANSHKVVTMILKEFEMYLSLLEREFAEVGFKVYYIRSEITKFNDNKVSQVESYGFEAFIPTLIPLLAGEKIYSTIETFSRELIQNSIDAINIRNKLDNSFHEHLITIINGNDEIGKYFMISDTGTGMSRYILERYFTTIGRSFYISGDFNKLNTNYNPISQFGIGFLSCFMVGKKIEVLTKYYEKSIEGIFESYYMDIPNFDGCFFIESTTKQSIGTSIKIYEDPETKKMDIHKIKEYILNNIVNPQYNIKIDNILLKRNNLVKKILEQTQKFGLMFQFPINKCYCNGQIDDKEIYIQNTYSKEIFYGCYFYVKDIELYDNNKQIQLLNAGIKIQDVPSYITDEIARSLRPELVLKFNILAVLESQHIELDVSRDTCLKIKELIEWDYLYKLFYSKLRNYFNQNEKSKKLPYYIYWLSQDKSFALNIKYGAKRSRMLFSNDKSFSESIAISLFSLLYPSRGRKKSMSRTSSLGACEKDSNKHKITNIILLSIYDCLCYIGKDKAKEYSEAVSKWLEKLKAIDYSKISNKELMRLATKVNSVVMTICVEVELKVLRDDIMPIWATDRTKSIMKKIDNSIQPLIEKVKHLVTEVIDSEKFLSEFYMILILQYVNKIEQEEKEMLIETNYKDRLKEIVVLHILFPILCSFFISVEDIERNIIIEFDMKLKDSVLLQEDNINND